MVLETFSSPDINFKNAGVTQIFTPSGNFFVTSIVFAGVDVTGGAVGATVNIGTNGSSYDNFIAGLRSIVPATEKYQLFGGGGSVMNVIQGGSPLQINVVTPDNGAITNVQRVDITGYYI